MFKFQLSQCYTGWEIAHRQTDRTTDGRTDDKTISVELTDWDGYVIDLSNDLCIKFLMQYIFWSICYIKGPFVRSNSAEIICIIEKRFSSEWIPVKWTNTTWIAIWMDIWTLDGRVSFFLEWGQCAFHRCTVFRPQNLLE
jgi:hypothetical protein